MSKAIKQKMVVVGLGYVGLPLALAFSAVCEDIIGFDINADRVSDLRNGVDHTQEANPQELAESGLEFSSDAACLEGAHYIIVTVPTPTDKSNRPDFSPLKGACNTIGKILKKGSGAIIVFESTVYPTATEQFCGPILEQVSGLKSGVDFKLAYSPERINPGDKEHPLAEITKIVSGQDAETLDEVASIYKKIIRAGVHCASSIAVAEAAKVIENTQRDLNIALMNEVALICDRLEIPTLDVIDAAATKWNFLRFTPGLVGGHCIGVDPYYLTAKAEELGYHPDVILSGRRINDQMPDFIAHRTIKLLAAADRPVRAASVGVLGLTFKEDVPDFRNSKVFGIIEELNSYGITPLAHDPYATDATQSMGGNFELVSLEDLNNLDCLILAVPHDQYRAKTASDLSKMLVENGVVVDVKTQFSATSFRKDISYWSL
jgi:UDP-N-acetyl-D-galactosamine dehydrogenase